jgi:glycosyltransferase involved in cell wall biosynthesis
MVSVDDKLPISAVLITRDAELHLDRVLRQLLVCSEIVVLDSGSRDSTRDIALRHGVVWHEHPFDGYGPQKRRAVALCRHEWIISVDGDEVLDDRGVGALTAVDWDAEDPRTCWEIRRRPFIGNREIRHGDWAPDRVVRVFNRQYHNLSDALVHESVEPTGRVRRLDGSLLHYTSTDLAGVFRTDYYRLKAEMYRRGGRRAGQPLLAARAVAVFLRGYLLRRGFLDGTAGLVVALAGAVNSSVGLALASDEPPEKRQMG